MKSPWKFLIQLASRGRSADGLGSTREIDAEKPDAPSSAPSVPADDVATQPVDPVEAATNEVGRDLDAVAADTAVVEVDRRKEASTATVDRTSADNHALQTERGHPPQLQPAKRQTRARKARVRNIAVADAVEYEDGSSGVPLPPMTFFDEVAALDEEIKQLRRRLAEKLFLQNAQLKKMLERFEAS